MKNLIFIHINTSLSQFFIYFHSLCLSCWKGCSPISKRLNLSNKWPRTGKKIGRIERWPGFLKYISTKRGNDAKKIKGFTGSVQDWEWSKLAKLRTRPDTRAKTVRLALFILRPIPSSIRPIPSSIRPIPSSIRSIGSSIRPIPSSIRPILSSIRPITSSIRPIPSSIRPILRPIRPIPSSLRPNRGWLF